ncbi:MAG: MFS transporter [Dehalococcoidales bacterium]|nr:MFS transporter [Dehalococcoidales bacterium]
MNWKKKFTYSLYVMIMAALMQCFIMGAERMCLPVLFPEISRDMGLSSVQLGTIWALDPFAGIFVSLFAGLIVDRFGIKLTLTIVCLMSGILGALRGFSSNFITLAVIMFTFGIFIAMLPTVLQKAVAVWYPGKRFALAFSITNVGGSTGMMLGAMTSATLLSPALGSWRNVVIAFGILPVVLGLLWMITGRAPKKVEPTITTQDISFRQLASHVLRIKEVWIIGLVALGVMGTTTALSGYIPIYMEGIGWSSAGSGLIVTIISATGAVGGIPIVLLSNRLGSRTKIVIPSVIISALGTVLFPYAHGPLLWAVIVISGIARGGILPLITAMVVEMDGIGVKYAGTALGLITTFIMIGGALTPPLGTSLTVFNPAYPFVLWGMICALSAIGFFFIKEKRETSILIR